MSFHLNLAGETLVGTDYQASTKAERRVLELFEQFVKDLREEGITVFHAGMGGSHVQKNIHPAALRSLPR